MLVRLGWVIGDLVIWSDCGGAPSRPSSAPPSLAIPPALDLLTILDARAERVGIQKTSRIPGVASGTGAAGNHSSPNSSTGLVQCPARRSEYHVYVHPDPTDDL
jgi:hypothetical protein